MQTNFTLEQLADAATAEANDILRNCVHCGFCMATCPTYVLKGDERDSPRGRIYQIKEMLEEGRGGHDDIALHLDRCLSCLNCMTTCPSGVDYMHLVDHARAVVEETWERPWFDRSLRKMLEMILPWPNRFRLALIGAMMARPLRFLFTGRLRAMLDLAPAALPGASELERPGTRPALAAKKGRVVLLPGCAQAVLAPSINESTTRLLRRIGIEVVIPSPSGCCGALTHHMGKEESAKAFARNVIDGVLQAAADEPIDAVLITASGCGTTIKDYGHLLQSDPAYADKAARVAALSKDISEYLDALDLPQPVEGRTDGLSIAYHSACSMQHGQKITKQPPSLLKKAGFDLRAIPESNLCCGSAGTYNIMQPDISGQLRARKAGNINSTGADIVAAGNIGCLAQLESSLDAPILHTAELLDWAYGGPVPEKITGLAAKQG